MEETFLAFGLLFFLILIVCCKKNKNTKPEIIPVSYTVVQKNKKSLSSKLMNLKKNKYLGIEDQIRRFKPPKNAYAI